MDILKAGYKKLYCNLLFNIILYHICKLIIFQSLLVTADSDVNHMDLTDLDPTIIQRYIKSLQTLQEKLDTVSKFPVKLI